MSDILGAIPIVGAYKYGSRYPKPALDRPVSKSWLFEIVNKDSKEIVESFTLILPPQAYSIKEPQRVSITKTFGNAFIDDYGPDNIQITIKGISGTVHAFPTFQTSGVSKDFTDVALTSTNIESDQSNYGYTGRTAFYKFRNTIMRYKDTEGWENNELRVYDLADEQAYKCILLEFALDRNSDKPLHYPFTISLFVYERLDQQTSKGAAIDIAADPETSLTAALNILSAMNIMFQNVATVVAAIAKVTESTESLRNSWRANAGGTA
jgi:hypothetical protein